MAYMCGACKAGELETGVPQIEVTPEMISEDAFEQRLVAYYSTLRFRKPTSEEIDDLVNAFDAAMKRLDYLAPGEHINAVERKQELRRNLGS